MVLKFYFLIKKFFFKRTVGFSDCDVEGHVTVCFPDSNMAAEDLPSEFDVVILGTGIDYFPLMLRHRSELFVHCCVG